MVTALAPAGAPRILLSLQYARAVAALLVVYAHLSGFAVFEPLGLPEFGGMGVDLFFVISGFVMWESAGKHTVGEFVLRRVARIVPAYWFYTSLLVLLALAAPSLAPNIRFDGWALAGSYFFIPYTNWQGLQNPILLQGWTLNYEAFFYGVFAISLWLPARRSRFIFVAGLLLSLCVVGVIVRPQGAAATLATSPMLLEFVVGMAISAVLQGWAPRRSLSIVLAVAGSVALVAAELVLQPAASRVLFFGIPAGVLLVGLIGLEQALRRRPNAALLRMGDASYSLYLCHPFVLSAAAAAVRGLAPFIGATATALVFAAIGVLGACAVALLSFHLLEKPLARRLVGAFAAPPGSADFGKAHP
ncbi:MAG: acyltransferase [Comamonadaceae bacterium]|nr:MAG: acyltransferase [Comamonadaceae bacterium]